MFQKERKALIRAKNNKRGKLFVVYTAFSKEEFERKYPFFEILVMQNN